MSADGAVTTARFSARTRKLLTIVNLHWAALALLGLVSLWLMLQLALAWRASGEHGASALAQQQIALRTADLQAKPLQGLDAKLAAATEEANDFSMRRLPYEGSQYVAELGALAKRQGVRLTRVQYLPAARLEGTVAELTEVRMDASLSGDYRPLMLFINSLERDRMFFVITGVVLSGQQGGTVGLRLRLTTYVRAPRPSEALHAAQNRALEGVATDGAQAPGEGQP